MISRHFFLICLVIILVLIPGDVRPKLIGEIAKKISLRVCFKMQEKLKMTQICNDFGGSNLLLHTFRQLLKGI